MMRTFAPWYASGFALIVVCGLFVYRGGSPFEVVKAQDGGKKSGATAAAASKTHQVQPGLFRIDASVEAVVESPETHEIALRPRSWSSFKVLRAVERGTAVKKGDVIVQLETDDLEEAIRDAKVALKIAQTELQVARFQIETLERNLDKDLENSERLLAQEKEDFDSHEKVIAPFTRKSVTQNLKMAEHFVEYQKEELRQLEKMYKADDLTEETEEIILKRARNDLEMSLFMLESAKVRAEQQLRVLPREAVRLSESIRKQSIELAKLKVELPTKLAVAKLQFEKSTTSATDSGEKLKKLQSDLAMLTVTAPADGVVYYGQATRGKWSEASPLQRGNSLQAHTVFATVVQPAKVRLRLTVTEKDRGAVAVGKGGQFAPAFEPERTLRVKVESVAAYPLASGSFDAVASLADGDAAGLVPGMTGKAKLALYENPRALTLPSGLVHDDEASDEHFVYVSAPLGRARKQPVVLGRKKDKLLEIVSGLKAGDQVFVDKPDEKTLQ